MSDLISRQHAIDEIRFYITEPDISDDETKIEGYNDGLEMAISILSILSSVEPERKWIPVTEKLPWTDTNVLVTVLDDSGDTSWSYTSIGWLTPNGKYWVVDGELCYGVVAWMPLPEPWRSDQ